MGPNQQSNQSPQNPSQPQPSSFGQGSMQGASTGPQPPSSYTAPGPSGYDPNYLDSIAPAAPRAKFLSGTFGKVFWVLIALFVLAVSLIVAFSGRDETADLQQMVVRLENFSKTTKIIHKHFKSKNLTNTNSTYQIWITNNRQGGEELLQKGGIKKTDYNKEMVKSEAAYAADLDAKYEDARLAGKLNRVYAASQAAETEKLINMLNTMAKKNKSSQIRDYAKNAASNLKQIHEDFDNYIDDGN